MNGTEALARRVKQIADNLIRSSSVISPDRSHNEALSQDFPHIYDYLHWQQTQLSVKRSRPVSEGENEWFEPDHADREVDATAFGAQLAYLHNEFNFDAARPIRNFALATHISFIPLFTPKWHRDHQVNSVPVWGLSKKEIDQYRLPAGVTERFALLRARAVHQGDSFFGGKDSITSRLVRFLDYEKKIITTMRSIERMHDMVAHTNALTSDRAVKGMVRGAAAWNRSHDETTRQRGLSSRLSMLREYALKLGRNQSSRLTWVRHHSHYQTITAVEEAFVKCDDVANQLPLDLPATPTLNAALSELSRIDKGLISKSSLVDKARGKPALHYTAFDGLPPEWADYIFGRYLQGANYLFLPAPFLFSPRYLAAAAEMEEPFRAGEGTLQDDWLALCSHYRSLTGTRVSAKIGYNDFLSMWSYYSRAAVVDRRCTEFLFNLLRPLIVSSFPQGRGISAQEFCLFGASEGGAAVLSNVRNMTNFSDEAPGTMLMSETVVLDFGLNDFERGRLFKQLSEFSTERMRSLSSLGTFRFLNDALEAVHNSLANHIKAWLDDTVREQAWSQNLTDDRMEYEAAISARLNRPRASREDVFADRLFAETLKGVTIDLTILNDLVEGGISTQSAAVEKSVSRMRARLAIIGDQKFAGFLNLEEFLQRRFDRSAGIIGAVGSRYDLLRRRVAELSALVETHIEMSQRDDQRQLLEKVDRLTLFGITYYFGTVIAYTVGPLLALKFGEGGWHFEKERMHHMTEVVKLFAFLGLAGIGVFLGLDVFKVLVQEIRSARGNWTRIAGDLYRAARTRFDSFSA